MRHGNGPEGGDVWPSLAYRLAHPLRRRWTPPVVRRLSAGSADGAKGGCPDAGQGMGS